MKDDRLYLHHVIECMERIRAYLPADHDEFLADLKTQDAVIRNLQIMAESTQQLSAPLKERYPAISWKKLSGFRNVLVHDYLGVNPDLVWEMIVHDLDHLEHWIRTMLSDLNTSAGDR